ncbi:MAG: nitric oxide synthase oxygenase, partial [Pseudomonadota bacterium]|nr:nitric oxide synthase oxygenase [Pseudomonadota bacterium]
PETGEVQGLSAPSDWSDLPRAIDLLLQGQTLSAIQQEAFAQHGRLLVGDRADGEGVLNGMVCSCRAVTAIQLRDMAAEGASVEDMVACTGAGTVCGGCRDMLPLFTQTAQETLCWIEPETLPGGVVRVRLNVGKEGNGAAQSPLQAARPGDFVRVSAMVKGQWLQRPYTLTDWDDSSLEITVKLEEPGQFSDWLRAAAPGDLVKVGVPEGSAYGVEGETRALVFIVAGIGVTPALAAVRRLVGTRSLDVRYVFRDPAEATGLPQLQSLARAGDISLATFATGSSGEAGGQRPSVEALIDGISVKGPVQVVVCGPEGFNNPVREALASIADAEVIVEDFQETIGRGVKAGAASQNAIRPPGFVPDRARESLFTRKAPGTMAEEAEDFLREFYRSEHPEEDPTERLGTVMEAIGTQGSWRKTADELAFAAQLAWRNAPRCIGRLYWKGLHLRDGRDLQTADDIARALFEHMRFAFNGGAIRPAITVFDPGGPERQAPRIWNSQLQLYAGYRLRSGQQIGDPAQNALTQAIMALGWEPSGSQFEILPLVIQGSDGHPQLFE